VEIHFLTSTPLNVVQGSGTFVGIATLARGLRELGATVEIFSPSFRLPVFTAERLVFNEMLWWRRRPHCDVTVGFDMDGYRAAGRDTAPHVASIKGVIADEMSFERGLTRATMAIQARCEALHVRRAALVMTTSRYAASRLQQLYGLETTPTIVPELIDLSGWRELFRKHPAEPDPRKFTVLCVCRFYPRKRLHLLLEAAAALRRRIPSLDVRIVGGGPEARRLARLTTELRLDGTVRWLGDVSQSVLAMEYQRADVFCLPSVQEGFGIVFLEAMAAGKPIVAAKAAAVPEVVRSGLLVEPESAPALVGAIERLYLEPELRSKLSREGLAVVESFDAPLVASQFLKVLERLI